jgi:hypothetical protein
MRGSDRDGRIVRTEQTWAERLRDPGSAKSLDSGLGLKVRLGSESSHKVGNPEISKPSGDEEIIASQGQYSFETDAQAYCHFLSISLQVVLHSILV